jgi:bacterioferritin
MKSPYVADLVEIRKRAREHVEQGAVTPHYGADRDTVLKLLNDALATEIVCVLRYRRHSYTVQGLDARPIADELRAHADEEADHAHRISERIVQLGGAPDWNPDGLSSRSHSEYVEGRTVLDMVREDLVAERVAIESYTSMIRFLGDDDPTTRRLFEEILAVEEEHAQELADLLASHDLAA